MRIRNSRFVLALRHQHQHDKSPNLWSTMLKHYFCTPARFSFSSCRMCNKHSSHSLWHQSRPCSHTHLFSLLLLLRDTVFSNISHSRDIHTSKHVMCWSRSFGLSHLSLKDISLTTSHVRYRLYIQHRTCLLFCYTSGQELLRENSRRCSSRDQCIRSSATRSYPRGNLLFWNHLCTIWIRLLSCCNLLLRLCIRPT